MEKKTLSYYKTLPYRMQFSFDTENMVWLIRYPELPGCLAHGDTKKEAIARGEQMKSLWLETLLDHGEVPPEPQREGFA